jgi:indole-3-glycerol phosphate synthase
MAKMPDILERICRAKRREIAALRKSNAAALALAADRQSRPRGFRAALESAAGVALIAEVKKASPSVGLIRQDFDPVGIARAYEQGGAACISVLTDSPFFQGESEHLSRVRQAVAVPVLRKDAYLLIVAALEPLLLDELLAAGRELGMDALVEVHDEGELATALSAGADLIGINNRDLRTFAVSLDVTERLASRVPSHALLVAESGIKTRADVERLKACGVKAVLVGESLMRAADIEAATRALLGT